MHTIEPTIRLGPCTDSFQIFQGVQFSCLKTFKYSSPVRPRKLACLVSSTQHHAPSIKSATTTRTRTVYHRVWREPTTMMKSNGYYRPDICDKIHKPIRTRATIPITTRPVTWVVQTNSAPRNCNINKGRWTKEEHEQFVNAYKICGNDWKRIADEYIPTRERSQVASHAQKFLGKMTSGEALLLED
jgi:SHAQKYF class myb-like DNA-binding protein